MPACGPVMHLLQIHERGKRYEVEWQAYNNRGEQVETGDDTRINFPVMYSIATAIAEAASAPDSRLARKEVMDSARIGSWCIWHPEQPWGTLDPFSEDLTKP